jgi:MULE transposase domain
MSLDGFMQLFTINGFIVADNGEYMQVPFAFAFMRSRRTVDYVAVINSVKNLLLSVSVEEVISDFEPALKSTVKISFPTAHHFGCLFHTKQAMGRTANELGLTPAYRRKGTPERK